MAGAGVGGGDGSGGGDSYNRKQDLLELDSKEFSISCYWAIRMFCPQKLLVK
jgi:hypothetical protein